MLGNNYIASGADSVVLQSITSLLYQFQNLQDPVMSIVFLIGATCIYLTFYRARLIPRWLSVWGFIAVVTSLAAALLKFFHMDTGIGFYLEMVMFPQELVMAVWLIVKGFNPSAIAADTFGPRQAAATAELTPPAPARTTPPLTL